MIEAVEYATPSQIAARDSRRRIRNRIAEKAVHDDPIDLKKRFKPSCVDSIPCCKKATPINIQYTVAEISEYASWWKFKWGGAPKTETILNSDDLYRIIEQAVCLEFLVDRADIIGKTREHRFVRPRHLLMYLVRTRCRLSYPVIGRKFDCRHHTSVMYACERTVKMRNMLPDFDSQCRRVIARIDAETG